MTEQQSEIVTTQWLHQNLDNPNLRILDVTWYSAKDAKEEYLKEHIPGAVFFDLFKDAKNTDVYPRNIPEAGDFEKNARDAGINGDSHVIVYDSEGKCGYFLGSRAWWTFTYFGHTKVSILDGGLQKWKSDGHPVTSQVPNVKQGSFTVKINTLMKINLETMQENLAKKEMQVLDSRPPDVYGGKPEDPKSGHYPGAINIPFAANLLDKDKGTFKSKEQLRKLFEEHGVELDKPIVTMCNSGMSSCSLLLATRLAGSKHSSVYQAGFTEWKTNAPETNIEKS